jgi:prevent-host-death family protein
MSRAISSNEAKQRWGSVLSAVVEDGDEIVVESHGKPKAFLCRSPRIRSSKRYASRRAAPTSSTVSARCKHAWRSAIRT